MIRLTNSLQQLFSICRDTSSKPEAIIQLLDSIKFLDWPYFGYEGQSINIDQEVLDKLILDVIHTADLHNPNAENILAAKYFLYVPENQPETLETDIRDLPQLILQLQELYKLYCIEIQSPLIFIHNKIDILTARILGRSYDGLEPSQINASMRSILNTAHINCGSEDSVGTLLDCAA